MFEFLASGSPRVVSRAIEEYARAQGNVTALVVPWESSSTTLSMAVTSVKSDGWAIEHTNLGTITLAADGDATRVGFVGRNLEHPDTVTLAAVFDRFARDARRHLEAGTGRGRSRFGPGTELM